MTTIEKIKKISREDADIGLNYGHYTHLAKLINDNNYKRVIEIGVAYGNLSEYLLGNTNIYFLLGIDPYIFYDAMPGLESQEDYDVLKEYVINKVERKNISRCELIIEKSDFFLTHYGGGQDWDMVFIDGDHSYDQVKKDIDNYSPLIRQGGILSGHDITVFEGVDKAVYEYQKTSGKELKTLPGNIWYFEM